MKIAIDIHGTIDAQPDFFSKLTKLLKAFGVEIHVTTGVQISSRVIKELADWQIEYDYLFSITDYHVAKGTPIKWDEHGNPWIEDEIWNRTKGQYCWNNRIDLTIDDSPAYGKYFSTPYMRFKKESMEKKGDHNYGI